MNTIENEAASVEASGRHCQASNRARVFPTNRRLTALVLVPRLITGAGSGSKLRAQWASRGLGYRPESQPRQSDLDGR